MRVTPCVLGTYTMTRMWWNIVDVRAFWVDQRHYVHVWHQAHLLSNEGIKLSSYKKVGLFGQAGFVIIFDKTQAPEKFWFVQQDSMIEKMPTSHYRKNERLSIVTPKNTYVAHRSTENSRILNKDFEKVFWHHWQLLNSSNQDSHKNLLSNWPKSILAHTLLNISFSLWATSLLF